MFQQMINAIHKGMLEIILFAYDDIVIAIRGSESHPNTE